MMQVIGSVALRTKLIWPSVHAITAIDIDSEVAACSKARTVILPDKIPVLAHIKLTGRLDTAARLFENNVWAWRWRRGRLGRT
jgi:hypothetical protein